MSSIGYGQAFTKRGYVYVALATHHLFSNENYLLSSFR